MKQQNRVSGILTKIGLGIVILGLLLPVGMYAVTGWSSRMMADDYCFTSKLQKDGFVGAQVDWYQTWTNRFTTTFLISISEFVGRINFQIWPTLLILGVGFSLYIGFKRIFKERFGPYQTWMAVLSSALVVFILFFTSQNRVQSLYWRAGSVTYTGSLVIPGILISIILSHSQWSHNNQRLMVMLCLVTAFFGAGFSESFAAVQTTLLVLGLLAVILFSGFRRQSEVITKIIGGLAGSLLGMVVVFLAPGNQVRQGMMTPTHDIGIVLTKSFQFGWDMLNYTVRSQPVPLAFMAILVLMVVVVLAIAAQWKAPSRLWMWIPLSIICGYIAMAALCAPSIYAQSSYPETRVLLLGKFILEMIILGVCIPLGLLFNEWVIQRMPKNQWVWVVALLIVVGMSVYPLRAAWQARTEQNKLASYATQWDQRDQQIKLQALNSKDIVVNEIQSQAEIEELKPDANNWVNHCAADYYRVNTIQAANPAP